LIISRSSQKVKVIGHSARSEIGKIHGRKYVFGAAEADGGGGCAINSFALNINNAGVDFRVLT